MNAFVSIDTTRRVAPLLRHGRLLLVYRRDDEDNDAATEVQTVIRSVTKFHDGHDHESRK